MGSRGVAFSAKPGRHVDIVQPLPLLKAQGGALLDQAALQVNRGRQATTPADPWRLLPGLLRNGLACLDLTLGFAAVALRPGAEVSLLREWQRRRASRRAGRSEVDYIRRLSGEKQD